MKQLTSESRLEARHLSEDDKRQICSWQYEGEYAVYNLPPYEKMRQAQSGFMNPGNEKNYYGFFENGVLVGFVNIKEKPTEFFIGIGVRPDICGKGYGTEILGEVCRIAKAQNPAKPLCLEVRTWNKRAVRCYEKAGFTIDGDPFEQTTGAGKGIFYRMIKV